MRGQQRAKVCRDVLRALIRIKDRPGLDRSAGNRTLERLDDQLLNHRVVNCPTDNALAEPQACTCFKDATKKSVFNLILERQITGL